MNRRIFLFVVGLVMTGGSTAGAQVQTVNPAPMAASAPAPATPLIPYNGLAVDAQGKSLGEVVSVSFQIFGEQEGGEALWSETQTLPVDAQGHYQAQLGATLPNGIPARLFASGEARWLEVQVAGEAPQPRTLLTSVPYAMKAADADLLGGRSVSDFVTTDQLQAHESSAVAIAEAQPATTTTPSGSGTANYLPLWTNATTLGNSGLYQSGSGSTLMVGIGTNSPSSTLFVNGTETVRGALTLPSLAATSAAGVTSPPLDLVASVFNSATQAATPQRFRWRVLISGNNTPSPASSLSLSYGTTTTQPTGLSFSSKGIITFAPGQTFPGAVSTSGQVNAGSYELGGTLFAYSPGNGNAFLGFAGNGQAASGGSNTAVGTSALDALTSGFSNSALGFASLHNDTTGGANTAMGALALEFNSTGTNNTAFGAAALTYNVSGNHNTAIGDTAGPDSGSPSLVSSTAIGANATVSQSNSLVLGQTTAGSPGASYVNVGVGTATPATTMEIAVNAQDKLGPTLTLTNPGGTSSAPGYHPAAASIDFKTYLHASTAHAPTSRIEADDDDYSNDLRFFVKGTGSDSNPLMDEFDIYDGEVDISNYFQVIGPAGIYQNPPKVADIGGTVDVEGYLYADAVYASTKDFLIDHPADPENKLLYHASVESSEMMNIYSGNVVTDNLGLATVKLPEWFQAENTDYRYQLTVIGRDAHAWIAEEVANNQFKIASNATNVKISWQITAIRQDAYAKAHPLIVEQEKPADQRGFYIHPELYGQPQEKKLQWGRAPNSMRRSKLARAAAHPSQRPASNPAAAQ